MADDDKDEIKVPNSDSSDDTDFDPDSLNVDDLGLNDDELDPSSNSLDDTKKTGSNTDNDTPENPEDISVDDILAKQTDVLDDPTVADEVPKKDGGEPADKKKGLPFTLPKLSFFGKKDGDNKFKLPGIIMVALIAIALIVIFLIVIHPSSKQTQTAGSSSTAVKSSQSKKKSALSSSNANKIINAPTNDQSANVYAKGTTADQYSTLNDAMNKKEYLNTFFHNAILRYAEGKTNQQSFQQEIQPIEQQLASLKASIPSQYSKTDQVSYDDVQEAIDSLQSSLKSAGSMTVANAVNEYNSSTKAQSSYNSKFISDITTGMTAHKVKYNKTTDAKGGVDLKIVR